MTSDLRREFRLGPWTVEPMRGAITGAHGETRHLEPKLMDVLLVLAEHSNEVVTRDELFAAIWPGQPVADERLTHVIAGLRRALEDDRGHPKYIETSPKRGYRLLPPVCHLDDAGVQDLPGTQGSRTRSSRPRLRFIVAAVVVVTLGILFTSQLIDEFDQPGDTQTQPSIAVLPFVNLNGNSDYENFSDGLTDTLIHVISQLPGLKVSARTSAFFFKGKDVDIRQVADKLGVTTVLEGTVQREGNKVRIFAQLIDTETEFHIWSKTYSRELDDIFDVQDEIAKSVALAMNVTSAGDKGVSTNNLDAYKEYLRGLQQKNIRSVESLELAAVAFRAAVARDPDFYEAQLELADTYFWQAVVGAIPYAKSWELGEPIVDRLLEEKPENGLGLMLAGLFEESRNAREGIENFAIENHFEKIAGAIERTPNEPRLYAAMARLLRRSTYPPRPQEEVEWLRRGLIVDPLASNLHWGLGNRLRRLGELDKAEASYRRAIELNPDDPVFYLGIDAIYWQRKQYAEWFATWRKIIDLDPLDIEMLPWVAWNLYTFGLMEEGDKYLQHANEIAPENDSIKSFIAYRHLLSGDFLRARELTEAMLREDFESRLGSYELVVMIFTSAMSELDRADEALTVLEELRPGISSPDFYPGRKKDVTLQYHAILARAKYQSQQETQSMLETVLPRWDQAFPRWREDPGAVAAIEMARGNRELALELTIENLDGALGLDLANGQPYLFYRHFDHYKAFAKEPPVVERLARFDAEAKQAGDRLWAYIVENGWQL